MIYSTLAAAGLNPQDHRVAGPGTFRPIGSLHHHTASPKGSGNLPSLRVCQHGRPGIPGPLCQILIGRDATIAVITDGRANHAGAGRWPGVSDGNGQLIGIEIENDGVGEPYSLHVLSVVAQVTAALNKRFGQLLIGHKEWAPGRKIDPTYDMNKMRTAVIALNAPPVAPEVTVTAPVVSFDLCEPAGPGKIRVAGWAYDPDEPGKSIEAHVHVHLIPGAQPQIVGIPCNVARHDVNQALGIQGNHGFDSIIDVAVQAQVGVNPLDTVSGHTASTLRPVWVPL